MKLATFPPPELRQLMLATATLRLQLDRFERLVAEQAKRFPPVTT